MSEKGPLHLPIHCLNDLSMLEDPAEMPALHIRRTLGGPGKADRLAKRLVKKRWSDITYEHLREGDVCRLFEKDGTPIKNAEGKTDFVVMADPMPYTNELGIATWILGIRSAKPEEIIE